MTLNRPLLAVRRCNLRGETALLWIITLTGWLVFIALLLWTLAGK